MIWYASRLWDNFGQLLISNHSRILHITLQPCPCHWPLTRPAHLCQALSNGRAAAAESNERRKIGAPQGPFDRIQSTYTRGNSMIYYQRSTVIAHFRYKWSMGARTFGMVSSAKKTTSKSVSWTLKKRLKARPDVIVHGPYHTATQATFPDQRCLASWTYTTAMSLLKRRCWILAWGGNGVRNYQPPSEETGSIRINFDVRVILLLPSLLRRKMIAKHHRCLPARWKRRQTLTLWQSTSVPLQGTCLRSMRWRHMCGFYVSWIQNIFSLWSGIIHVIYVILLLWHM